MNTIGKDVLRRWTNDFNLQIDVLDEPYFSYYIDLYDPYLKTKAKINLLEETLNRFESEGKFLSYYYETRNNIIEYLNENPAYLEFNNMDMNKFNVSSNYPKNEIYKCTNIDKYFVSVDLTKANFQALKYVNPEIVKNADSYKQFIGKFTDLEYMMESKYLRQVIFGNINAKRQIKIERYLIEKAVDWLLENNLTIKENIEMVASDEIVFNITEEASEKFSFESKNIINAIKNDLNLDVDVEIFKLFSIGNKCFAKEFVNNKKIYELKSVSKLYLPQVYKKYTNQPLNEYDLVFRHEGKNAKYLEPYFEGDIVLNVKENV